MHSSRDAVSSLDPVVIPLNFLKFFEAEVNCYILPGVIFGTCFIFLSMHYFVYKPATALAKGLVRMVIKPGCCI